MQKILDPAEPAGASADRPDQVCGRYVDARFGGRRTRRRSQPCGRDLFVRRRVGRVEGMLNEGSGLTPAVWPETTSTLMPCSKLGARLRNSKAKFLSIKSRTATNVRNGVIESPHLRSLLALAAAVFFGDRED